MSQSISGKIDWNQVHTLLKDCTAKSKNSSVEHSINEIMLNYLSKLQAESKEIRVSYPLYSLNNVMYYADSNVIALREQLLKELGLLTATEIFKYQRNIPVLYRAINQNNDPGSIGALQFFENLLKISELRLLLELQESTFTNVIIEQSMEAGDFPTVLKSVIKRWEKQEMSHEFMVNELYKSEESLKKELVLEDDLRDLLDQVKNANFNKKQELCVRLLERLSNKYELPEIVLDTPYKSGEFSQRIKNLQSEIEMLILEVFKQEEEEKVASEFNKNGRIANLMQHLHSITLGRSMFNEAMNPYFYSSPDKDFIILSKEFTSRGAFDRALESIERISDPKRKCDEFTKLLIVLLENKSDQELKEVIKNIVSSKYITYEDIQSLHDQLKKEIRSFLPSESECVSLKYLSQMRYLQLFKLYRTTVQKKHNDIELSEPLKSMSFTKSGCVVL